MTRKRSLIKALIHYHWKNILRDNARIDSIEMDKRLKVISGLKAKIAEPDRYKTPRRVRRKKHTRQLER